MRALQLIKFTHTVVWVALASCVFAIWGFAWQEKFLRAALMIGIILVESAVLALHGWRCPLSSLAARYTEDDGGNFDIYLPAWLARNNKLIFGTLFLAGIVFTLVRFTNA